MIEVTLNNPAYWRHKTRQLAQLLTATPATNVIADPTGRQTDSERAITIADPVYWSTETDELREVLRLASLPEIGTRFFFYLPPFLRVYAIRWLFLLRHEGSVSHSSQERLTLTVEEAAAALGISRSFAYEAIYRKEIPHVKIGRRILVPKAALQRMLDEPEKPKDRT